MQVSSIKISAVILLWIWVTILLSNRAYSQIDNKLSAYFVKEEILQKSGELSFNVVKIFNNDSIPRQIQPILDLPVGWVKFSNSFVDTLIPANSDISIPFRFKTSQGSASDYEHKIYFKAFDPANKTIAETSFIVKLEAIHIWDVILPEKRAFFYPGNDIAQFEIIIRNMGNSSETINVEINTDKNISLSGIDKDFIVRDIYLEPMEEEIINLEARYTGSEERIFDVNKVRVIAKTEEKKVIRSVILEKYSDEYSPFEVDRTLSHETEVGIRTFANTSKVKPFLRARGVTDFKNDSKLRYNLTYYDILDNENVINNSYYNVLYKWDDFNAGIGAFSSTLGRNLYSRNCLMVSNVFHIDEVSSIEGFASYGLVNSKTNIAAAFSRVTDRFQIKGSLAYDIDSYHNRNTASAVIHTGRFNIFKNHEIRLSLYGYNESYDVMNPYSQMGYAWDFNYFGKISDGIDIHFTNNYGSPDIPGPQMGLRNYSGKIKFTPGEPNRHITLSYVNSARDYYFYDADGLKLPDIHLRDNYASFFFHNNSHKKARWYVGPSIEFYNSSHPLPENKRRIYDVDKYRMEFKGYFGRNIMINVKYGLGVMNFPEEEIYGENVHDFHVLSNFNKNGYGIRLAYDYGPMVNMGLYQYALDAGNHSVSVSPYALKQYFNGRVSLSLFTNYTYRFDMKYGTLNVNPKIETYIFKDWYAVIGGTYTYTQQNYGELKLKNSFYYAEFSIKKRWGSSDYYKWRKELRRMKIQLFKDTNGNGKMDPGEQGISNVKVRIELVNTASEEARENFPVDITLMTNEKGIVYFTRIPKGFYSITILPMTDLQEYFYIDNKSNYIELNRNANVEIPFQKADKIIGIVELKRNKFVTDDDVKLSLSNIKVSAFNEVGDSYSTFTRADGSFIIYAPGNHIYTVRIKNVFGNDFIIMNNDSKRYLSDSVSQPVVIRVLEKSRKIKFKKVPANTAQSREIQKIKVLPGKIYENSSEKPVDISSIPDFKISELKINIKEFVLGKYYLSSGSFNSIADARKMLLILDEQGVDAHIRTFGDPVIYHVVVDEFEKRNEAQDALKGYLNSGLKNIKVFKIKKEALIEDNM